MTTQEKVALLSTFVNRDDAGRHFTQVYPDKAIASLEAEGLIEVTRPVHDATGISWDSDRWTAEVTPAGVELVEAYPEYQPVGD